MAVVQSESVVPTGRALRALILEDCPADVELVVAFLRRAGYSLDFDVVDSPEQFQLQLEQADYDVILADYNLRAGTALDALEILGRSGKDIPLVLVTGTLGEEAAVECIKRGAADYVLKDRLHRLPTAVERAIREQAQREAAAWLEEQIRRAKQEWELTFDSVPDPILITDEHHRIRRANRATAALAGLEPAQVIDRPCYEVVHGMPGPIPGCPFEQMVETGKEVRLDICDPRSGKLFDATATPLYDDHGRLRGSVHVLRDITERKKAEEALRESNQMFQALVEASPLAIVLLDAEGRVRLWNPAAERMFGWRESEVLGRPLPIIPDDKQEEHRALRECVLRGERFAGVEVRRRKKDGTPVDISLFTAPPRDPRGKAFGIVGIMEDITARKQAEEERARLSSAVEQTGDSILVTDPDGIIVYANPAFERTTGYSQKEVIGRTPRILKSGKHDAEYYRELWATLLRGEVWSGHFINRRKDGSVYEEEATISPVRDASGRVVNYVGVKRDVTHVRRLEEQLRQAQKMEAIGRLAGGVAHDFNNLVTIITGYSDLMLQMVEPGSPMRQHLEEVKGAGERAAGLTRQLLSFSRKQVLAPQLLDLNKVVAGTEKMLRRLIGEDVELRTALAPRLEPVTADPGQIEQVIMNLVVNARDAMPQGGKLTIETANMGLDPEFAQRHFQVPTGRYVMLAVSDTGLGMDAETQARIFEPFFTTKEPGKGTGLGLATVYGIVKQSGGHVYVYSEPHQGTTFKIYLPVTGQAQSRAEEVTEHDQVLSRGTETILLVEDETAVRALAAQLLEEQGYTVLACSDPEEAVASCEKHPNPIHLLLTDVVMPKVSGQHLAEHLALLRPDMRVLYMSGYTDDMVVRQGIVNGGTPFLPKPFTRQALARKVRETLDGPRRTNATKPASAAPPVRPASDPAAEENKKPRDGS